MSAKHEGIYLGKNGKVFGPYTQAKLDEMRLSGDIRNYTFIWDASADEWRTLEAPPPKPGAAPTGRAGRRSEGQLEAADAICHDYNQLVAGTLRNVSDMGCELVSHDEADSPVLALDSALVLSVLDAKGDKALNVRAAVSEVTNDGEAWVYSLRWARRPSFEK
jgi:hypothetical protein